MTFTKLILGSGSPRRQDLIKEIWNHDIEIRVSNKEESYPADMIIMEVPVYLARQKAQDLESFLNPNSLLLTADTVVILGSQILGKPTSEENAKEMLSKLSGQKHQVITGVCIRSKSKEICFSETTEIFFNSLSTQDIEHYVTHYKPMDKAGSYGIQEFIGMIGIKRIEGCYYNVMGLPTSRIYQVLRNWDS